MAVTAAITSVVATGASLVAAEEGKRDQKNEAKKTEREQLALQAGVKREERNAEAQRGMIAKRLQQQSMAAWDTGKTGGGVGQPSGGGGKTLLGL